ncbi:hypothetical protein PUNSTDRAFT_81838 [Punctularia strigosozonata HHB-11173 SS5]|uniref:uncharacterized protein n=1 Tax=Punctularia strigosozonata (strain HHB-11173) TaxID=741275 RepID=UPI0004418041|nr:uncharacterized protein PUNSTDRAFT_81838 [Punctularia strigosozonata HHB-11173 SS5]EIN12562.1 hypothetical protein PUNSTDRAFT_81838 [Punctularia strigosozonata HHB-11173 SS5]
MARPRRYSPLITPSLDMGELVCKTLDHDATDVLIDKWLENRNDAYWDWFAAVRERKHAAMHPNQQILLWQKGDFVPENVFCRTVDTGRLIPLDRTWTTHVYHHRSLQERKLSMMPVVFTMLPELMLLRGMHDHGSDDVYIIVTDMKRQEMEDVTAYFQLVCQHTAKSHPIKPSAEGEILREHMRLTHTLNRQRRTPCFPQIDLTLRAILAEKRPPFIILFSHQATSYSQIFFTHRLFVPSVEIFHDFPSGCPNPCCNDECEMIRFPRKGLDGAAILPINRRRKLKTAKDGRGGRGRGGRKVRAREMCNWIDCTVCFDETPASSTDSSEGSQSSGDGRDAPETAPARVPGRICSKCKLVKYCSPEHQKLDWDEHRRVCVRPAST